MRRAIGIWAEGDEGIAELNAAAQDLHAHVVAGDYQARSLDPILARIDDANRRLTPLEIAFSNTLGEASRRTQGILEIALILAAGALVVVGIALSRRMLRTSDALENALRVSEERFDLAVDGSNAGIWDWNLGSGDVYYSPRYKELLGYEDDEFPDTLESFLNRLHPDDRAVRQAALEEHRAHGAPYDYAFRLRIRSGEYRWFEARGKSVRDANGEIARMAGSITDITDRKQAEAQLYAETRPRAGHAAVDCRRRHRHRRARPRRDAQSGGAIADGMDERRGPRSATRRKCSGSSTRPTGGLQHRSGGDAATGGAQRRVSRQHGPRAARWP